jgi:hypothetical protein
MNTTTLTPWQLIRTSFKIMTKTPKLLIFSSLGIVGIMIFLSVAPILQEIIPGLLFLSENTWKWDFLGIVYGSGCVIISTFFQISFIAFLLAKFSSGDLSIRSSINKAWSVRWSILGWSLLKVLLSSLFSFLPDDGKFFFNTLEHTGTVLLLTILPVLVYEKLPLARAFRRALCFIQKAWKEIALLLLIELAVYLPLLRFSRMGWDEHPLRPSLNLIVLLIALLVTPFFNTFIATLYIYVIEGVVPQLAGKEGTPNETWVVQTEVKNQS